MTQPQLATHLNPGEDGFNYGAGCDMDGCDHEARWYRVIVSGNPTAYEYVVRCPSCDTGECTDTAPCLDCADALLKLSGASEDAE